MIIVQRRTTTGLSVYRQVTRTAIASLITRCAFVPRNRQPIVLPPKRACHKVIAYRGMDFYAAKTLTHLARRFLCPAGLADRSRKARWPVSTAGARQRALARSSGVPRSGAGRCHTARHPRPGTRWAGHHYGRRDAARKL